MKRSFSKKIEAKYRVKARSGLTPAQEEAAKKLLNILLLNGPDLAWFTRADAEELTELKNKVKSDLSLPQARKKLGLIEDFLHAIL